MFERGKRSWLVWNIIVASLLAILGITTLVNNNNGDFQGVIILIVAIFIIVDAGFRLLFDVLRVWHIGRATVIKTRYAAILSGAAELSLGIALIHLSNDIRAGGKAFHELFIYLGNFFGTAFICFGGVGLILAIIYFVKRANRTIENIISAVVAGLLITLGVLILIFCRNEAAFMRTFFIFFGIILVLAAVASVTFTIFVYGKLKELKQSTQDHFENAGPEDKIEPEEEKDEE